MQSISVDSKPASAGREYGLIVETGNEICKQNV